MSVSVRYTRPPGLHVSFNCTGFSCGNDTVSYDGDDFVCSECMTIWRDEGDEGQLYEKWNGEEDRDDVGEAVDPDEWPKR